MYNDCWEDGYEEGYRDGSGSNGRPARRQWSLSTAEIIERNNKKNQTEGCYIATTVYGSYDCPQVLTLRRFRDQTLARRRWGRAFIRVYYALSPTLVRWFGRCRWFTVIWRSCLDPMVARLDARDIP